jgi:hypothetical protein
MRPHRTVAFRLLSASLLSVGLLAGLLFDGGLAAQSAQNSAQQPGPQPVAQQPAPAKVVDPQLAATLRSYGAESWPRGALRPGFELGKLVLAGLSGGECEFAPPAPWARRFADAAGTPRVLVEVVVADSAPLAHERLAVWLSTRNNPEPEPTASSQGIVVGDVGFVGLSAAPRISWIAFTRGNVAVRVSCLDPRVDPHPAMPAIATAIDLAILAVPPLPVPAPGKGAVVPKPVVARFAPQRASCTVGDQVVLDLDARDPAGDAVHFEFVVGGPGQGYVEADAIGRQVLHTTKEGAITLTVQASSPMGTLSEATARIDVLPR